MALDEPKENEQTVNADGIEILISDDVIPFTSGQVLDWVSVFGGEGFVLQPESGLSC